MRIYGFLAAAAMIAAVPAGAQVLDNFNRADAPTLGSGWTNVSGGEEIISNTARSLNGAATNQLATYNGGSGNTVSFDIAIGAGGLQYGAAVINYSALGNYFIKVQSQNGTAFDYYGFYTGNNNNTGPFTALTSSFTSAHVVASVLGGNATLTIMPNVGATQTYTYTYTTLFGGSGIGLGFYGDARLDNFGGAAATTAVPEPATWAMMILGFGLAGAAVRRRARTLLAAA